MPIFKLSPGKTYLLIAGAVNIEKFKEGIEYENICQRKKFRKKR